MSREKLIQDLREYELRWPGEKSVTERFVSFVSKYPDCFERSLECGHITGSAWIVDKSGEKVLLTHHRKLEAWFQLGGHADGIQDAKEVAMSEAIEESGISNFEILDETIFDIDIHLIPARKNDPDHYHYDIRYLLRPQDDESFVVSEESLDLSWVPLADIQKFTTEESMLRMARKWADYQATTSQ